MSLLGVLGKCIFWDNGTVSDPQAFLTTKFFTAKVRELYGVNLSHHVREQIYEAHDAVNYLIIVFPLCDMNLLEYKERGLMTEDKVRD